MKRDKNRNIFSIINNMNNSKGISSTLDSSYALRKVSLFKLRFHIKTFWNNLVNEKTIDELAEMKDNQLRLCHYLGYLKDMYSLRYGDISEESNFKETIIKDVFSERRNPNRDMVIGLSFAFKLNLVETNLLLKTAGYNDLYPRKKRDRIVIKFIEDDKDIHALNDILDKYSLDLFGNLQE